MLYTRPQQNFVCDADGNIVITIKEDHESLCQVLQDVRDTTKGWTEERTMKLSASIPVQEYHHWGDQLGYECWENDDFVKWFHVHTDGRYLI